MLRRRKKFKGKQTNKQLMINAPKCLRNLTEILLLPASENTRRTGKNHCHEAGLQIIFDVKRKYVNIGI